MKPGQNPKQRSRGRSNNNNNNNNNSGGGKKYMPPRNQTFDSSGPDIRIRGNAHQVLEKYLAMARDASAQGDRISAENYYQHAEHYFRMINHQNQNGRPQPRPLSTPADDHLLLAGDLDREDGDEAATEEGFEPESEGEAEAEVVTRPVVVAAAPVEAPVEPAAEAEAASVPEGELPLAPPRPARPRRGRPPRQPPAPQAEPAQG